jgi:hypothetical protein
MLLPDKRGTVPLDRLLLASLDRQIRFDRGMIVVVVTVSGLSDLDRIGLGLQFVDLGRSELPIEPESHMGVRFGL